MKKTKYTCSCGCNDYDKGRAVDGRRAYRCKKCGGVHTNGMQGREKRYNSQRISYQFKDSKGKLHCE